MRNRLLEVELDVLTVVSGAIEVVSSCAEPVFDVRAMCAGGDCEHAIAGLQPLADVLADRLDQCGVRLVKLDEMFGRAHLPPVREG